MVEASYLAHHAVFAWPLFGDNLEADRLESTGKLSIRQAAWYKKEHPTFSDALAATRLHLWQNGSFLRSGPETETVKIPKTLYHRLVSTIAYAT